MLYSLQLARRPNCDFCPCGEPLVPLPGRNGARACVYLHGITINQKWPVERRPVGKKRNRRA